MLKGIPPILSPELLKVLCEMGHMDEITIGDGNFPGHTFGKPVIRLDGHGVPEILDAIRGAAASIRRRVHLWSLSPVMSENSRLRYGMSTRKLLQSMMNAERRRLSR